MQTLNQDMKHRILFAAAAALAGAGCFIACKEQAKPNPFMEAYTTPYAIPPFDQISYDDYLPALEAGIAQKQAQVDSITANPETPTFDNTILALEQSGEILDKVAAVFFALDESNNTPEMAEIAETFYPTYSQFSDKMMMDAKLFDRVNISMTAATASTSAPTASAP